MKYSIVLLLLELALAATPMTRRRKTMPTMPDPRAPQVMTYTTLTYVPDSDEPYAAPTPTLAATQAAFTTTETAVIQAPTVTSLLTAYFAGPTVTQTVFITESCLTRVIYTCTSDSSQASQYPTQYPTQVQPQPPQQLPQQLPQSQMQASRAIHTVMTLTSDPADATSTDDGGDNTPVATLDDGGPTGVPVSTSVSIYLPFATSSKKRKGLFG